MVSSTTKMVPNISHIACLCLLLHFASWTHAELFTAIAEMEPLLQTHKRIIDDLDHYIIKEEERIGILKRHLSIYKLEHDKAMDDIPNYLGNPINAFTLIKRLTTDLDDIEDSIKIGTEYIKNITMSHADVKYPTLEDLAGAAQALTRLQTTYHLSVPELSEGVLNGVKYSYPMSASDCFELMRALYNMKDYKNALEWAMVALSKLREDPDSVAHTFTEIDLLEYISFSHYLTGEVKTALEWAEKLLELDPEHTRARGNLPHFRKTIAEQEKEARRKQRGETGDDSAEKGVSKEMKDYAFERKKYEALCRGEMDISSDIAKRLTCRYLTENHPFLRLAPLKVEQMYISPDVFVFHEAISDDEIKLVQDMAMPRFKRAVVHDPKTGELVPANYRISKSAWLRDAEATVVARVTRRVADMTGLSVASAEELQVVNYGIGGHYEPHYDFARKFENPFNHFDGNRIATVLFYAMYGGHSPLPELNRAEEFKQAVTNPESSFLPEYPRDDQMSEVAQGGATVFTELGLSVFPVKNAALFWLNLHPSGEGDMATRHAACPVLRGSKWVCNKWLHQGGQELLKPCSLDYQEEGIQRKIPRAVPKSSR